MVKQAAVWKLLCVSAIFLVSFIVCVPVSSWAEDIASGEMLSKQIEETALYPALLEKEVDSDNPKPTEQHEQTVTGSYVNHLTRSYSTGNPGLSMKVPGGSFSLNSSYEKGNWGTGIGAQRDEWPGFWAERAGLS